tara:strand:- start:31519 stop:32010 length:492 start_codon:yes stop_codon:yes gene_type:complete
MITILGLILSIVASYLIYQGYFLVSGLLILISGFMDMMDGALARRYATASQMGAFLDSVTDRISEAALLFGILLFYLNQYNTYSGEIKLLFLTLAGSMLVSYLRARGESLNIDCKIGIMTRPERILLISIGLLFDQLSIILWIMATLSALTIIQRFLYITRRI